MVLPLIAVLALQPAPPPSAGYQPVHVWLAAATLAPGTRTSVYVETAADGYLLVLHRKVDGTVEVLFPGTPMSDAYTRAGTYEIRGADGGPAIAAGPLGTGTVLAALSPAPIRTDEFAPGGEWNGAAFAAFASEDAETALSEIVQRMLGDATFNYDVASYTVFQPSVAAAGVADTTSQYASEYPPLTSCDGCTYLEYNTLIFAGGRRHHGGAGAGRGAASTGATSGPTLALYERGRLAGTAAGGFAPLSLVQRRLPVVHQLPTRQRTPPATRVPAAPAAPAAPRTATRALVHLPPLVIVQRPDRASPAPAPAPTLLTRVPVAPPARVPLTGPNAVRGAVARAATLERTVVPVARTLAVPPPPPPPRAVAVPMPRAMVTEARPVTVPAAPVARAAVPAGVRPVARVRPASARR